MYLNKDKDTVRCNSKMLSLMVPLNFSVVVYILACMPLTVVFLWIGS